MKFLLSGTYSSFNKGDAAMQISTAEQLSKTFPQAEITIASPFPHYDKDLYKDYRLIKSHRRNLILSTALFVPLFLYVILRKLRIHANFLLLTDELKSIEAADCLVDLSGDTITEDYGPHVTYSHLLPIIYANVLGTPTCICAQSMGPFKITKRFTAAILKQVSYISARESITYKYLQTLGIPTDILFNESDMAFLLEPSSDKATDAILKKENFKTKKPILGVTVSNIIRDRFNAASNEKFETFMASILDEAINTLGVTVLFVGHVTGPSSDKDDRLVAKTIYREMKNEADAHVLSGDYTPNELKGIIKRCAFFLGSRMHSNIGAISSNVPTIAISYSHKTEGIMGSVGMGKYVIRGDKLTKDYLISSLSRVFHERATLSSKLQRTIPKIKSSSYRNIENIRKASTKSHA